MRHRILFVCLGNICRSPTAEAVFRQLAEQAGMTGYLDIDSAGTAAYHVGEPPDRRSQAAGRRRGYDLSTLRARQVNPSDFQTFDYLLAMDRSNQADLLAQCPAAYQPRVQLFLSYLPAPLRATAPAVLDVPDPYYGGAQGFEQVLDLCEAASHGLLAHLRRQSA